LHLQANATKDSYNEKRKISQVIKLSSFKNNKPAFKKAAIHATLSTIHSVFFSNQYLTDGF